MRHPQVLRDLPGPFSVPYPVFPTGERTYAEDVGVGVHPCVDEVGVDPKPAVQVGSREWSTTAVVDTLSQPLLTPGPYVLLRTLVGPCGIKLSFPLRRARSKDPVVTPLDGPTVWRAVPFPTEPRTADLCRPKSPP